MGAEPQLVQPHLIEEPALAHARGRCRRDQRLEAFLVKEEAAHLHVEQLGQLAGQRFQVFPQLGQVGDRRRRLEEVRKFLEVLVGAAGELQVFLDDPEIFEAPKAGQHHHREEEDGQKVRDR